MVEFTKKLMTKRKQDLEELIDGRGRKTYFLKPSYAQLPPELQAAILPQNNAIDDLVEQLNSQLEYAQTCLHRVAAQRTSYGGSRDDVGEILDDLVGATLSSALLVHGWADIYPGTSPNSIMVSAIIGSQLAATEHDHFEEAKQKSASGFEAYYNFQQRSFHLLKLRTCMQVSQHVGFQPPVLNLPPRESITSLLDLTIQETIVGKFQYYRKILLGVRGSLAQELYNAMRDVSDALMTQGLQTGS